jgi:hypothetical protein
MISKRILRIPALLYLMSALSINARARFCKSHAMSTRKEAAHIFRWVVAKSECKRVGCGFLCQIIMMRWKVEGEGILVAFFQVTPLGYFIHVPITTPIASVLKNYYR